MTRFLVFELHLWRPGRTHVTCAAHSEMWSAGDAGGVLRRSFLITLDKVKQRYAGAAG